MEKKQEQTTTKPAKPPASTPPLDPVEEASSESFPASDSPAWNSGHDEEVPSKRAKGT